MNNTKIVCTIGPACEDVKTLTAMAEAGMNVARLNFSHGDYDNHAMFMENIRKASAALKKPIAILQDLQGPKIRVGKLPVPVEVKIGDKITIGKDFPLDFDISQSVKAGQTILIEDGLIELRVEKVSGKKIACMALTPGKIQSHKGINLPHTKVKFPILTSKDIQDLQFGLKHNVDYVALSFVRNRRDISNLKRLIKKYNPKTFELPKVIAKIEKPEAVKGFDGILAEADGIMIARGDLGVELPAAHVPILQKTIIQKCIKASKPAIVATQMLDSMIRNPRPTRAEVSDVANAVIDHADAVMLSGETAFGQYPVETVRQMSHIVETTEKSAFMPGHRHLISRVDSMGAISDALIYASGKNRRRVVVGATLSGATAREISHERPPFTRIIMLTPSEKVLRQMSLLWGVAAYSIPLVKKYEDLIAAMLRAVRTHNLAGKNERLVLVAAEPMGLEGQVEAIEISGGVSL